MDPVTVLLTRLPGSWFPQVFHQTRGSERPSCGRRQKQRMLPQSCSPGFVNPTCPTHQHHSGWRHRWVQDTADASGTFAAYCVVQLCTKKMHVRVCVRAFTQQLCTLIVCIRRVTLSSMLQSGVPYCCASCKEDLLRASVHACQTVQ